MWTVLNIKYTVAWDFKTLGESKQIMKKILRLALSISLKLHSFFYKLSSYLAIRYEGKHPKHRIIKYADWFDNKIEDGAVIIDVGSNKGQMTKILAKSTHRLVYGIEIEPEYHADAIRSNTMPNLHFILADATEYDYSKIEKVDVITLSNVLEHIEYRAKFLSALVGACRWSSAGPRVLVRVPAIDREWTVIMKKELGVEWRLDKTHFTEYTDDNLIADFRLAELQLISLERKFGEIYAEFVGKKKLEKNAPR